MLYSGRWTADRLPRRHVIAGRGQPTRARTYIRTYRGTGARYTRTRTHTRGSCGEHLLSPTPTRSHNIPAAPMLRAAVLTDRVFFCFGTFAPHISEHEDERLCACECSSYILYVSLGAERIYLCQTFFSK